MKKEKVEGTLGVVLNEVSCFEVRFYNGSCAGKRNIIYEDNEH
jgi:hypothetical protein